jgi:hypothetical protein
MENKLLFREKIPCKIKEKKKQNGNPSPTMPLMDQIPDCEDFLFFGCHFLLINN